MFLELVFCGCSQQFTSGRNFQLNVHITKRLSGLNWQALKLANYTVHK